MNRDIAKGTWKDIKGTLRSKWGKLTQDDVEVSKGTFESLAGLLQKRYGYKKEEAEKELDAYLTSLEKKSGH
jgi:uncharacterized protein YjbJ (UPF0337 family)